MIDNWQVAVLLAITSRQLVHLTEWTLTVITQVHGVNVECLE